MIEWIEIRAEPWVTDFINSLCQYVLAGGMRATLIADYTHTLVLYCILIAFALTAYAVSPLIGSPTRMWELLQQASEENPIAGNAGHSYLTMRSTQGLIFGVLNIVGNFGELSIPDFCGVIISIFPS